jgi:hypothetical protein
MSYTSEADLVSMLARGDAQILGEPHVPTLPQETPESRLLAEIRKLATPYGWLLYHTHDSRHSDKGFPDTVLTNGREVLMYELKDNKRKPTEEQAAWISLLQRTGKVEAGLWRPRDWPAIAARLTRKTP